MPKPKVVIIHQIEQSMTNLEDTLSHFNPDYVYLITPEYYSTEKPDLALLELENKNVRALGDSVRNVTHTKMCTIKDAWHNTTMMEFYEILGEIKSESLKKAGKDGCEFYVGLSDAGGLMAVGAAFSAVLHNMKTYYTRGRRRREYKGKYVLEVDNLNNITSVKKWLEKHEKNSNNLRYLDRIINLEDAEDGERIIAEVIHQGFEDVSIESVRNAINRLEQYNLVTITGNKPKVVSSTKLGRITMRMFHDV